MKSALSRRWVPALLAAILLDACGSTTVPDPEQGMFTARWDGRLWIGDASAFLASDGRLSVHGTRPRGADVWGTDESLSASVAFTGPGVYALRANDVHFFELVGGDVISAQYDGTGDPAGTLRITRFDGAGGIIEGELSFSATTNSEYASYGRTAQLEDGKFRAIVHVPTAPTRLP